MQRHTHHTYRHTHKDLIEAGVVADRGELGGEARASLSLTVQRRGAHSGSGDVGIAGGKALRGSEPKVREAAGEIPLV